MASYRTALLLIALAAGRLSAGEMQEWHDPTGKVIATAECVGINASGVQLKRDDGRTVTMALTRLSPDDQLRLQPDIARELERQGEATRTAVEQTIKEAQARHEREAKFRPDRIAIAQATLDMARQGVQACTAVNASLRQGVGVQPNQSLPLRSGTANINFQYRVVPSSNKAVRMQTVSAATIYFDQPLEFAEGLRELAQARKSDRFPLGKSMEFRLVRPGVATIEVRLLEKDAQQVVAEAEATLRNVSGDPQADHKAELQEYQALGERVEKAQAQIKADTVKLDTGSEAAVKRAALLRDLLTNGSRALKFVETQLAQTQKKYADGL